MKFIKRNKPTCIVGVDIADPHFKDMSAITAICINCKTFIWSHTFKETDEEDCLELVPKVCPNCGVKFTNTRILHW